MDLKVNAVFGHARDDRCAVVLADFTHFMEATAQITLLDTTVLPFA